MAAESFHTFHVSDISKDMSMNIRITGVRLFTWRCRIATWLIELAAIVFPFTATVEFDEGGE